MNDNDYFFVDRSAEHKARRERLAQKKVESWKRINFKDYAKRLFDNHPRFWEGVTGSDRSGRSQL